MARVGFKKTYATFDDALSEGGDLIALLRTYAVAAGFSVRTDTAETFEFWTELGVYDLDEDRPRYRIQSIDGEWAFSSANDAWISGSFKRFSIPDGEQFPSVVSACFDGDLGVFWLLVGGVFIAASRQQRLFADMRPGVAARFGIFDPGWNFLRPPSISASQIWGAVPGEVDETQSTAWTPIGGTGAVAGDCSVPESANLPPMSMIAPIFAGSSQAGAAIYAGELLDVMAATSDHADGAAVLPGWMVVRAAIEGGVAANYVVRAPAAFDDLDA